MTKILIIEDIEINAEMLKRRLAHRGFQVSVAHTGAEGIDMATSKTPDVILMDISLPGMDGLEATRLIRGRPEIRWIPIIMLTSHALDSDRERAMQAGCDDFETKPIDLERLIDKIRDLTPKL